MPVKAAGPTSPSDELFRPLPDNATDPDLLAQIITVHAAVSAGFSERSRGFYKWWSIWNRIYFQETLKPLFIYSGNTDYGKFLGFCRYLPTREILIQNFSIKAPKAGGSHHVHSVRRHEAFADLSDYQYGVALILLHEMIHQACFEADVDPGHEGEPWAQHCNYIGRDLGLKLTYSPLSRGKSASVRGEPASKRKNVWKPIYTELLPGTDRFATHDEARCFPWHERDPFIQANSAVKKENGEEVIRLPQF